MTVPHLLITGASSGIGRAAAVALAPRFAKVTLVGRSRERHQPVIDDLTAAGVEAKLVICDLSSLAAVTVAAASVIEPVDTVIANAAVGGVRGVTVDGFEIHFGVNHLAHHLLVTELADRITDRVVVVSSNAHFEAGHLDYRRVRRRTRSLTGLTEYRGSKLANVWFGRELARRCRFGVHIVHPGLAATDIWRRIPWPLRSLVTRNMASPAAAAETPVWAVTTPDLQSGGYFARCAPRPPSQLARDDAAAGDLFERSEAWLRPYRSNGA